MKIDCHVHVLDPARFPYRDGGVFYTPAPHETGTADQLISVFDAHGITHGLVVTPTGGYQSDNSVTLDALSRYPDRLRGIAVVETDVDDDEIDRLSTRGIVGIRIDLAGRGVDYIRNGRRLLGMMRERRLVTQIQCELDQLAEVRATLAAEAGMLVIDHCGRPDAARDFSQPGFAALLKLSEREAVAVKLSGPFRFSKSGYPYGDAIPFMKKIVEAFGPARCVWGSDWPFLRIAPRVDYGPCLAALAIWVPDEKARNQILSDSPAKIFGFGPQQAALSGEHLGNIRAR